MHPKISRHVKSKSTMMVVLALAEIQTAFPQHVVPTRFFDVFRRFPSFLTEPHGSKHFGHCKTEVENDGRSYIGRNTNGNSAASDSGYDFSTFF